MEMFSDTDPRIEHISAEISEYTGLARIMKLPYWVWVNNEKPIGLMIIGKEPIRMFAPAGTKMAIVEIIDAKQARTDLERFVKENLKLATEHDAEYVTVVLPFEEMDAIESFRRHDFRVLADSYQMGCQLDREFNDHTDLRFLPVKREEAREWVRQASRACARGHLNQEAIGVLEINAKRGTISNIGVKLSERNKGY
ncbi:MAG: hypothetical protein JSW72_02765 [Candidatus Bathyarchaeota archaeon]|nr:MAG: hypothetical protein JSW72_02765 [Candidatus Bathyarchaeota archaeon]